MKRISRRQFLFLSLSFAAGTTLAKAPRIGRAIGRPPQLAQPPRAYSANVYGRGVYGSGRGKL